MHLILKMYKIYKKIEMFKVWNVQRKFRLCQKSSLWASAASASAAHHRKPHLWCPPVSTGGNFQRILFQGNHTTYWKEKREHTSLCKHLTTLLSFILTPDTAIMSEQSDSSCFNHCGGELIRVVNPKWKWMIIPFLLISHEDVGSFPYSNIFSFH